MQGRIIPENSKVLQLFPNKSWQSEYSKVKELGFDYVELLYDLEYNEKNPLTKISNLDDIIHAANASNIELHSLCADYFTKMDLSDRSKQDYLRVIRHIIECSKILSISYIVIPFLGDQDYVTNTSVLKSFLLDIKNEVDDALKHGIHICLETIIDSSNILDILKDTKVPIDICYDLGNAVVAGYSLDKEIDFLKQVIRLVHIKDRNSESGLNVALGTGDVNFTEGFIALKKINYRGDFTLETAMGDDPINNGKIQLEVVQNLIRKHLS